MPTPTTNLALRKPLATEAPDGAGQIGNLADDIDQMLRIGGAEYCANLAAIQAIPAARTFKGKQAYAADTDAIYRYDGITWRVWQWMNIPGSTYGVTAGGASGIDLNEFSVVAGIGHLIFNMERSAGMSLDTAYFTMNAGFRPGGTYNFGGATENNGASKVAASLRIDAGGNLAINGNGGVAVTRVRGSAIYRLVY